MPPEEVISGWNEFRPRCRIIKTIVLPAAFQTLTQINLAARAELIQINREPPQTRYDPAN